MNYRPEPNEYGSAYASYLANVSEDDTMSVLEQQRITTQDLLSRVDEQRSSFRYEPAKWSIKGLVGHLCDAERIFGYRILAIARGDQQPLPGFDEETYAGVANFDSLPFATLVQDLDLVRRSTVSMLRTLPPDSWTRCGTANNNTVSVRALARIIPGHERHHVKILRERYGLT